VPDVAGFFYAASECRTVEVGSLTNKWALAYMGRSLSRTTTALRNKMRAKGFTRAGRRAVKAAETVPAFGIGLSHDGNRI
jgi:hypothetical protein